MQLIQNFRQLLGISLMLICPLFAQDFSNWQNIKDRAENNLVSIEYYEEIQSAESISQINKIRKTLSGVIVDSAGLIMTSSTIFRAKMGFSASSHYGPAHPPKDIKVRLKSGESVNAVFVGKDDDKNIAFIRTAKPLGKAVDFYTKKLTKKIGQKIFLVYQLGEKYNYQIMILERVINSIIPGPPDKLLTEIGTQNISFGLVFDPDGKNIGILYSTAAGFSAPYNYAPRPSRFGEVILPETFSGLINDPPTYKKKNTTRKKWLGVNMQPFTRQLARYFNAEKYNGILINTVLKGSPAEKGGLQVGDVLLQFNGIKLKSEKNADLAVLRNLVRESGEESVEVKVLRDAEIKSFKIKLTAVPISQYLADEVSNELLGFSAKELTKDIIMAKQLDYDTNGVWVSRVERAGWADLSGLRVGDLLVKIDNDDLQSIHQLDTFLNRFEKEKPSYVSLFVKRQSETRFLFIKTNFN
jgi:serine protease Do